MSLFAIFRSPLMFGGNLPDCDSFTLSLITNKDVLKVNQHSASGKQIFMENDLVAWTADDPDTGDKYLAFFNLRDSPESSEIQVKFEQFGLTGTHSVKNLWTGQELGDYKDSFKDIIQRHGAGLYRIH
jgi:alpha-galactosidase